jgi:transposase
MARAYSLDLRTRIVKTYEEGQLSMREVAQLFQVGKNFVFNLIKLWKTTGSVSPRPHGGGQPAKLDSSHIAILQDIVEENNDATLEELAELLEQKSGLKVSPSTICRQLQKLDLTLKKKTLHHQKQESEEIQEEKKNYKLLFMALITENLVFLDETGAWLDMHRSRGRSKKGKRCHGRGSKFKRKTITMIGAMAMTGLVASLTFIGGTNKPCFLYFVRNILVPALWAGAVVVMDNLNVHLNQAVREAIEAVGAKVLFLPRYCPDLNAIEMLWSKLKAYLKKIQPKTTEELDEAISVFVNSLTSEDVLGYFLETSVRTSSI